MKAHEARRVLLREGVDPDTVEAFFRWHLANPEVWKMFEKLALLAFADWGWKHWGAGAIAEAVRYEMRKTTGNDFKVNNNFRAYYARLFAAKYPEYADRLEFRKVRGIRAESARKNREEINV